MTKEEDDEMLRVHVDRDRPIAVRLQADADSPAWAVHKSLLREWRAQHVPHSGRGGQVQGMVET